MKYKIITDAIDAINEGKDVPKKIGDFRLKYVSTDGWRGYYEAVATKKSGWVRIEDGWVTGDWPDAGENASSKVEKRLSKLADTLHAEGKEMAMICMPTSNVFSTCFDVFARSK